MIQGIQSINDRKTAASNIILGVLEKSNKNHLIFVIDELDRCNPRYAVKLIEVIKHYFINVPIKVLFVTNNKQLSSIIEKNYGEKFSGYEYLDKIFDLIVNMPSYSHKEFIGMHGRVYDSQFSEAMIAVSDYYEMSLREMERYILLAELSTEHIDSPYLSDSHPNELRQLKYFTKYFLIPLLLGSKIKNEKDFTVLMSFKQNAVTRLNEIVSNIKYAQQMIKNFNTGTSLMYDATRIYSELISSDNYRTAQETEIIRQLLMNMVSNIVM